MKIEEIRQKRSDKEMVSRQRYQNYLEKIKERSERYQRRFEEAAKRRKQIEDDKRNKILYQRRSKSESLKQIPSKFEHLRPTSKAGVYINSVLSLSSSQGLSGFGRGPIQNKGTLSESYSITSRKGETIINTNVYNGDYQKAWNEDKKISPKKFELFNYYKNELCDWTSTMDMILDSAEIMHDNSDHIMSFDRKFPSRTSSKKTDTENDDDYGDDDVDDIDIPSGELMRSCHNSRNNQKYSRINFKRLRNLRGSKKVTFNKKENFNSDRCLYPPIKKPLHLYATDTKRGILLKMSQVNAKRRSNSRNKSEEYCDDYDDSTFTRSESNCGSSSSKSEMVSRGINTDRIPINYREVLTQTIENAGDNLMLLPEAKDDHSSYREISSCKSLLNSEKYNRQQKLAKLHQDFKHIEQETKRLTEQNNSVSTKYFYRPVLADLDLREAQTQLEYNQNDPNNRFKLFSQFLKNRVNLRSSCDKLVDPDSLINFKPSFTKCLENINNSCVLDDISNEMLK